MSDIELKKAILNKLYNMHMCVITCASFLPDTYLKDMEELFKSDPATDTVSNIFWATDIEGWIPDGVITIIDNADKEDTCEKLIRYSKKKGIEEWHLLYKDDNNSYVEITYDFTGDKFYGGSDVMLSDDGAIWDDLFNIKTANWDQIVLGIKK